MFVQPGHNTFEISQHRNWSEHVFILLVHHPTGKQIEKVEAKKKEDEAWNSWLEEMAAWFYEHVEPAVLEPVIYELVCMRTCKPSVSFLLGLPWAASP